MADEFGGLSFEDLQRDLERDQAATGAPRREAIEQFIERPVPPVRRVRTRSGNGGWLITRCSSWSQQRFNSIVHFEANFQEGADYAFLIGPACQMFEAEISRLVVKPACDEAFDRLLEALDIRDTGQRSALERWKEHRMPVTLGTACLVLLALRRGCEHGLEPVRAFLAEHFRTGYENLLKNQKPDARMNVIRDRYRNRIMHGEEVVFTPADYEQFVRLLVAHRGFGEWVRNGPEFPLPNPRAGDGLFHQHLSLMVSREGETP